MEERLRHLERVHARAHSAMPGRGEKRAIRLRLDRPHPGSGEGPSWIRREPPRWPRWLTRLGQGGVALGLGASACGGSLVAWAYFGARPELWAMGLPIAVAGQLVLLAGLAVQSAESEATDRQGPRRCRPREALEEDRRLRIDPGPHTLHPSQDQILADLAARLEELSRKLDRQAG